MFWSGSYKLESLLAKVISGNECAFAILLSGFYLSFLEWSQFSESYENKIKRFIVALQSVNLIRKSLDSSEFFKGPWFWDKFSIEFFPCSLVQLCINVDISWVFLFDILYWSCLVFVCISIIHLITTIISRWKSKWLKWLPVPSCRHNWNIKIVSKEQCNAMHGVVVQSNLRRLMHYEDIIFSSWLPCIDFKLRQMTFVSNKKLLLNLYFSGYSDGIK